MCPGKTVLSETAHEPGTFMCGIFITQMQKCTTDDSYPVPAA